MRLPALLTAGLLLLGGPGFVDLRLAGLDLLHSGRADLEKRFGRAEGTGGALVWRNRRSGLLLAVELDAESGSVRLARMAATPPDPKAQAGGLSVPRPLTGRGLSLGDPATAVVRALGRPSRREAHRTGFDLLYARPASRDGSLPSVVARYTFAGDRLTAISLRLGE